MNTNPPGGAESGNRGDEGALAGRLREHFAARYGEPPSPDAVFVSVSAHLQSPLGRAQTAAAGALHSVRDHMRSVAQHIRVTAEPATTPPPARRGRARRIASLLAPVAAVLMLIALADVLLVSHLAQPGLPVPDGWHDVTPPTPEAITSYAASPDVPGLILACLGNRAGNLSQSPMGPAQVWRTRDGGASWEQLPQPSVTAGCQIAPIRGEPGTFFLSDDYATQPALWVTHDQGDSWVQVPTSDTGMGLPPNANVQIVYQFLTQGVYRDGKLYIPGNPGGAANGHANNQAFSVTTDDGRSWTPIETARDVNVTQTYSIAADYRSSGAWFRLVTSSSTQQQPSQAQADALLEHSTDNGRTWAVVGRIKVAGQVVFSNMQMLATTPSQSGRVCVALWAVTPYTQGNTSASLAHSTGANLAGIGRALAPQGPPPPRPAQVGLYGSDDGGATWHGGTVAQYQGDYGGPVWHGVGIDPAGNCYLATTAVQFTPNDMTMIWRLAPGASAAEAVQQVHGLLLSYFALGRAPGDNSERFVALAAQAGPLEEVTCHDPAPCVQPTPVAPHLIWTDAP